MPYGFDAQPPLESEMVDNCKDVSALADVMPPTRRPRVSTAERERLSREATFNAAHEYPIDNRRVGECWKDTFESPPRKAGFIQPDPVENTLRWIRADFGAVMARQRIDERELAVIVDARFRQMEAGRTASKGRSATAGARF